MCLGMVKDSSSFFDFCDDTCVFSSCLIVDSYCRVRAGTNMNK